VSWIRRLVSKVDWSAHPSVVIESDDWGYCAWVPDESEFISPESASHLLAQWNVPGAGLGSPYSGSTLESAADVARLKEALLGFRGGDGLAPIFQPNYILAAPDFEAIRKSDFGSFEMQYYPDFTGKWRRDGLHREVLEAMRVGVWAPEYHGLMHFNPEAWLQLLREGHPGTVEMFRRGISVSDAEDDEYEYDPRLSAPFRQSFIERGVQRFKEVFGKEPCSSIAPDTFWTADTEGLLRQAGIRVIQSWRSQKTAGIAPKPAGANLLGRFTRAWRKMTRPTVHHDPGADLTYLSRTAFFEPSGNPESTLGATNCLGQVRASFERGEPAIISTHRHNFAHLDHRVIQENMRQFRQLLEGIIEMSPSVVFLTDCEVAQLHREGTSVLDLGQDEIRLRNFTDLPQTVSLGLPEEWPSFQVRRSETSESILSLDNAHPNETSVSVSPGTYRMTPGLSG